MEPASLFPVIKTYNAEYVYGYDNTDRLSFDDADNLLYVSEKYIINHLKHKLAIRLMSLLSYHNICTLMNNPACYTDLELNSAINRILQNETEKVLATSLFLELSSDAFLKVLEQDRMNINEIELWRAAVKWAKHRAGNENGEFLRKQLTPHLQLIRLCTLTSNELCQEVATTGILTDSEYSLVSKLVDLQQERNQLTGICNTLAHRSNVRFNLIEVTLPLPFIRNGYRKSTMTIKTKKSSLKLVSFTFFGYNDQLPSRHLPYQCNGTVEIARQSENSEPPVTVSFSENVNHNAPFKVSIVDNNGENMHLLPDNTYTVQVKFNDGKKICMYYDQVYENYINEHFIVDFEKDNSGNYISHCNVIAYKLIP